MGMPSGKSRPNVTAALGGTPAVALGSGGIRVRGFVNALHFLDQKTFLSASSDGTARAWSQHDGAQRRTLLDLGNKCSLLSMAFAPDEKTFVVARREDARISVHELASGGEKCSIELKIAGRGCLAYSPDGRTLYAAAEDKTARAWDLASGAVRVLAEDDDLGFEGLAVSPDGRLLAITAVNGPLLWLDAKTGKLLHKTVIPGELSYALALAFSPNGKLLAAGDNCHVLRLFEPKRRREVRKLKGLGEDVVCVAFSPDGRLVAGGGDSGGLAVWDTATGKLRRRMEGHAQQTSAVAFSLDGKTLASGGWDSAIFLWDVSTGRPLIKEERHKGYVTSIAFSPDGRLLATGGADKTIRLWDAAEGRPLMAIKGQKGEVRGLDFSPDGKVLASAAEDWQSARLWEVSSGSAICAVEGKELECSAESVRFSHDGKFLAISGNSGHERADGAQGNFNQLALADLDSGAVRGKFGGNGRIIKLLGFSPDSRRLAISSLPYGRREDAFRIVDVQSGIELCSWATPGVFGVTPDLQTVIAIGGKPPTLHFLRSSDGGVIRRIDEAVHETTRVLISADGRLLVCAGPGRISLRALPSGRLIGEMDGPGWVAGLAVSQDACRLAVGFGDGQTTVWDISGILEASPQACAPLPAAPHPFLDRKRAEAQGCLEVEETKGTETAAGDRRAAGYMKRLADLGWFGLLPARSKQMLEEEVQSALAEGCEPWHGLARASLDMETVYSKSIYSNILMLFAENSFGLLKPTEVDESWRESPRGRQSVRFSFRAGGRRFAAVFDGGSDWLDPDFFKLVNRALAASKTPLRFIPLDTGGQDAAFVLSTPQLVRKARKSGLLP